MTEYIDALETENQELRVLVETFQQRKNSEKLIEDLQKGLDLAMQQAEKQKMQIDYFRKKAERAEQSAHQSNSHSESKSTKLEEQLSSLQQIYILTL